MKSRFILLALFLLALGSTKFLPHLHRQDSPPLDSTNTTTQSSATNDSDPTNQETNAYYEALMQKQTQLKQALAMLNNQTQYLHNTLQKLQGLPEIQVVALEDALADELNILADLADNHTLPFEEQELSCSNISEGDISVLQASVTQIEHDLAQINAQIATIKAADSSNSSQELIQQLQLEAKWVEIYLNKLKSIVSSLQKCPQEAPVGPQSPTEEQKPKILYVTNPDAVNWIYGGLSPSDYYTAMLKYISDNKDGSCQISTCPIGTPFVVPSGQSTEEQNVTAEAGESNNTTQEAFGGCFQCPDELPLFDVSLGKCVACSSADGFIFVQEEHMCVEAKQEVGENTTGKVDVIVCEQHPQMIFNPETNKCECPNNNQYFNGKDCVLCKLPSFWNVEANACQQCPTTASFFYNTQSLKCEECPVERPLSTGLECQACALNEFFDISTLTCKECEGNKFFNPIHNQCECKGQEPYYNGTQCSACPIYQVYNEETQKCTQCATDKQFYNATAGKCQQCPEETPVGNMDFCLGCPDNTIFDKDLWVCQPCNGEGMKMQEVDGVKKCVCPPATPYLDLSNNQCISCYLPKFWNESTSKCESCPPNMIYSIEAKKCTICPIIAPLVVDGRCTPCPDKTHFNLTTGTCTECPGHLLYFEQTRSCIIPNCQMGSQWNEEKLECLEICKGNSFYNADTEKCICPPENPYYDNGTCVSCNLPQHWDVEKLACVDCEDQNQYFNLEQQECVFCEQKQKLNKEKYRCQPVCQFPAFYNQTTNSCEACPEGMVFSIEDKVCQKCPIGAQLIVEGRCFACPNQTHYDTEMNKCLACPDDTIYNPNLKSCIQKCQGKSFYNSSLNKCSCPIDIPFYDGQKCSECYFPKYWQVETQSCQYCPPEQYFDTDQGKCIPCEDGYELVFNNDSTVCEFIVPECSYPMYYDLEHKTCANCPADTIYSLLEKACVKCPQNKPLIINNTCEYCPSETHYDSINKKCIKCRQSGEKFSPELSKCVPDCLGESQYDQKTNKCACPNYRPFYDGYNCVSCYLPKYWDIISHSCQYCPTQQYFSTDLQKCVECEKGYHLSKETYRCEKQTPICIFPSFLNPDTLECIICNEQQGEIFDFEDTKTCIKCPSDKPLIVNYQCAACQDGTFYDQQMRVCVKCEEGTNYLRQSKSCQPICTGDSQIYNQDLHSCECTENSTYLNTATKECVKCELPRFWDYLSNECRNCSDSNAHYNQTIKQCYVCPYRSKFDLAKYTCVDDETICQYDLQQYYNYTLEQCLCPQDKPYFTSSHICVSCGGDEKKFYEYWDEGEKKCIQCALGMHYQSSQDACVVCPVGKNFNSISGVCENICPEKSKYNKETKECECIDEGYHWTGDHCAHCANDKEEYWIDELNSCAKCPQNSYFNLQFRKCARCPEGFAYNTTQKLCTKVVVENSCEKYAPRTSYNEEKKTCECPSDVPLFNTKENTCTQCVEDQNTHWDAQSSTCYECSVNQHYDQTHKSCVSCPTGSVYNVEKKNCVFDGPLSLTNTNPCDSDELFYNFETKECQCKNNNTPYYNGEKCVSCSLPSFWNEAAKKCEKCADGMLYNTTSKACVSCKQGQTLNLQKNICQIKDIGVNPTSIQPNLQPSTQLTPESIDAVSVLPQIQTPTTQVEPVAIKNDQPTSQPITQSVPDSIDAVAVLPQVQTINIPTTQVEPVAIKNEQSVQPTSLVSPIYVQPSTTTVISGTSPSISVNPSVVNVNGSSGSSVDTTSGQPITDNTVEITTTVISTGPSSCTNLTPYWDKASGKCVSCYLPKYWNLNTQACESCPVNQNYDTTYKKCMTCPSGYQFDFTRYKCIQAPTTSVSTNTTTSTQITPSTTTPSTITPSTTTPETTPSNTTTTTTTTTTTPQSCPDSAPFWNGQKCVVCYLPKYWNIRTLACESCASPQHYDISVKKCVQCANKYNTSTFRCE